MSGLDEDDVQAALLPRATTPLRLAWSLADERMLALPTEIIRTVLDPARAPAVLLPWLALQHRVKHTWDPTASVDQKRATIAAQYGILQHAATPKGLADALAQLGVEAGFDEWFEYGGQPYFIRLRAGVGGGTAWTPALDARVWATTIEYKRRSVAIGDFALVRTMPEATPTLAAAAFIGDDVTFLIIAPDLDPPAAVPALGAAAFIGDELTFLILTPDLDPPAALPVPAAALMIGETIEYGRAA